MQNTFCSEGIYEFLFTGDSCILYAVGMQQPDVKIIVVEVVE